MRSARYAVDAGRVAEGAGREHIDPANNAWLLEQMATHTDRQAHFTCLLVAVRHAEDPEPLIAEGHWCGQLLHAPQGEHGFGYDPLLWLPEHQLSAAQLAPEVKNAVSHRALACQQLLQLITARWGLGTDGTLSARWPWQSA